MSSELAYYNENDRTAAAWLRELIKAGLIAPGEVDERSIVDIRPSDLDGFVQCHFFAGVGVWSHSLRRAGWPDSRPVWTGSCPCQPFSAAGKGGGFDDERHLWPAFYHLIGEYGPSVVFGEQVASKGADVWIDLVQTDLEAMGYAFGAVPFPSAGIGAPHIRDRTYWVADATSGGRQFVEGDARLQRPEVQDISLPQLGDLRSSIGGLADALRGGTGNDTGQGLGAQAAPHSGDRYLQGERLRVGLESSPGGLDDAPGARHERSLGIAEGSSRHETRLRLSDTRCEAGRLGDAGRERDEPGRGVRDLGRSADRQQGEARQWQRSRDAAANSSPDNGPGPTNGIWRNADWLFCRDGKWRPVEPGTFPLAHGAPARVGRLRGYGNAINAEAATAFIEAFIEG